MTDETTNNIQELISAKAKELFDICDKEKKGFIIRKDMQRLRDELGVEPDQLEDVFDSLDIDRNGFLTLQEFTSGFGMFIGNQMKNIDENSEESIEHDPNNNDEKQAFHEILSTLGAKGLYDDEETIMALWIKLRETDPILLRQFEQFIGTVTEEIKRSKIDHQSIEAVLQSKSSIYDDEIKRLYEEMEQQIKFEKARVLEQEKIKEREIRERMEEQLRIREQQLVDATKKYNDLEMKLIYINQNETEMKHDNERLQKEKIELEQQLQEITNDLEESRHYISQLQLQTKQEKRDRAKQALNLTENLAIEHENLIQELDKLKSINKILIDERDLQHGPSLQEDDVPLHNESTSKRGSIISNYLPPHNTETLGIRHQPIGANAVSQHSELMNVPSNAVPDRIFKVAFIGDSGVGKTSFIQRFAKNHFTEAFSATLGVDLQVKMLKIDNRIIALQLWDTAGQERFRSITKQYLRKADGIVLIYDVTCEITFRNVRSWITSVQESALNDCTIVIVGNKIDLCNDDERRPIKYKDGARLADEYGCLFYESSARLGTSVVEIMEAIARIMQEKDDKLRKSENIIDLSSKTKKNSCC